jgi:hypothetical protein
MTIYDGVDAMVVARRVCNLILIGALIGGAAWWVATHGVLLARSCLEQRRVRQAEEALDRGDQPRALLLLATAGRLGVARLAQLLVASHTATRWPGLVDDLRRAGPEAREAVAGVLERGPEEHLCAAEALAALGAPRGVAALGQALYEPSPAAHPLSEVLSAGRPAVDALVNVARSGPQAARGEALARLGAAPPCCGRGALAALVSLAQDSRFRGRDLALRALGTQDAPGVDEILRQTLSDPDLPVRVEAIRQYGARRGARALGELTAQLHDRAPSVRNAVVETLGVIAGPEADALLVRALDDADRSVVRKAVRELGQRQCRAAESALARVYPRCPRSARGDIACALRWMNSPLATEYKQRWERETGETLEVSSEWDG